MESDDPKTPGEPEPPQERPAQNPDGENAPVLVPPVLEPSQEVYGGYTRYPPTGSPPLSAESNYPRFYPTDEGPIPPGPPTIRFAAIGEAWNLIQQDFGIYAVASLIMVVLSVVSYYAVQIPLESKLPLSYNSTWLPYDFSNPKFWGWGLFQYVASRIVAFYLGAGYFSLCLKRLRGEKISVWHVFGGFRPFFGMLAAAIIVQTLEAAGCLLFLFPGMFAVGVLAFVPQIMMDQRTGPFEAIRMSFFALKRDWALMWLLAFVMSVIAFAGALACGAGVVFTAPLYFFVLAIHYHAYFPAQGGPQPIRFPAVVPQPA